MKWTDIDRKKYRMKIKLFRDNKLQSAEEKSFLHLYHKTYEFSDITEIFCYQFEEC